MHRTEEEPVQDTNTNQSYSGNDVIIRVWLPRNKEGQFVTVHDAIKDIDGINPIPRVGHASLQTGKIYASIWPSEELKNILQTKWEKYGRSKEELGGMLDALFREPDGVLIESPEEDSNYEGGEPEVVVVLKTLDAEKINAKFAVIERLSEEKKLKWSLLGTTIIKKLSNSEIKSCSELIYDLLNEGGIKKIVNWDTVSNWWTVAPDAIARVVQQAGISKTEYTSRIRDSSLPPGISKAITLPEGLDLNFHENYIGYAKAQPSSAERQRCVIS